jgi:tRNA-uridine 2-sulfurtransferase
MKLHRVVVGLSGGVDSSVAALRLKAAGYDVIGAFIRTWHPAGFPCTESEDRFDAMRVAAHLNIPFVTIDARKEYEEDVARVMISEYAAGRTPNPDMLCNKHVKFAVLDRERERLRADVVATGHYARILHDSSGASLHAARDVSKDQSYFLSATSRDIFSHTLLPLGDSLKDEVRREAVHAGLPTATRKDSQGICFLGAIDMQTFLSHYIPRTTGTVRDTHGTVLGTHEGAAFYTVGERVGYIPHTHIHKHVTHYVVDKNMEHNELIVSDRHPHIGSGHVLTLSHVHMLTDVLPRTCDIVTRYHGTRSNVIVKQKNALLKLTYTTDAELPTPGQTCVLYQNDRVLASGIIE